MPASDSRLFISAALSLWRREVVRFLRQRSRIVGALGTPVVFWILIGSGLGRSFSLGSTAESDAAGAPMSFLEYFFPGTIALILLFTAIFSTISIIEDRREGFLQGVIASPAPRLAIVVGKVLGSTTLAVGQALLFLIAAPFAGVTIGLGGFLFLLVLLIVFGIGLSGLGFLIAWPMESTQGFHALMNLFLVPMWFLSGALFPKSGAAWWIGWLMTVNPMTYGVAALRHVLYDPSHTAAASLPSMELSIGVLVAFSAAMLLLSARAVGRRPSA